ncbi:MAG: hypothetical protein FJ314_01360 [SAR202 cluster bacterium]|nr:hypothetical protein [SAR202 cluster bacterium]
MCGTCAFARRIVSGKGAHFIMCGLARVDAAYVRYPRLPVRQCAGYRPIPARGPEGATPGSP